MGLIRAASEALRGTMADQWKDFFYCDALEKDILVKRGRNARLPVLPIQREMIMSFPTAAALRWQTASAC